MVMVRMRYLRVGRLDILPALAEVLPQLGERTEAQLPLQLAGVPLLGRQDLAQRVDLLLHLHTTHTGQTWAATNYYFCCWLTYQKNVLIARDYLRFSAPILSFRLTWRLKFHTRCTVVL